MTDSSVTTEFSDRSIPKNRSVPKKSLFRRLLVTSLALGLLGGGGWGVYKFTTTRGAADADQSASNEATSDQQQPSSSAAAEGLRNLLASQSAGGVNASSKDNVAPAGDRYALSPATNSPSSSASATPLHNPFASAPPAASPKSLDKPTPKVTPNSLSNPIGDRYSTALPVESTPRAKTAQLDVTRGQEPSDFNPLRQASAQNEPSSDDDAEAAFNEVRHEKSPTRLVSNSSSVDQSVSADRYRLSFSDESSPTAPSVDASAALAKQLSRQPAAANDIADRAATTKQPTRAYDLDAPTSRLINPAGSRVAAVDDTPSPSHPMQKPAQERSILASQTSKQPEQTARLNPYYSHESNTLQAKTPAADPLLGAKPLPKHTNPSQNPASFNPTESGTPTPGLTSTEGTGRPGERLLEGAQSPSVSIQKLAPEEIQVGRKCSFAIRVQNTGQRTAQSVQIRDEVPLGTQLLGTVPRASVSGSTVLWDLGTLSVGEERTVEMELLPTEEGELGSVATVEFAAQASAKARCTRPELALRLSAVKPKVLIGQQQTIQVEISNPGSGDATGVMLLESVPAGVTHPAGPALELEIGTLQAGESRRLELVLGAEKAGQIENVMTARAEANLQVEAACQFEVIAPKLQVSINGPQRRYLERPATYQVSVVNPGSAAAKDVQLVTHLPKGLQFVKANNLGEYDATTHSVYWSLPELPANERGIVELVALPIEAGEQTLQIDTKAKQGLEDSAEKRVMVEGLAAMMFEVVDLQDPIEIGGETTYEIRVVNQGSKAASNVQVLVVMPQGVRPLAAQGETRHTIQGERVIFAPLAKLAPKADVTYRVNAQGLRAGDQRVRVQVSTDDLKQPITKEESTRVYSDQ